MRLLGQFDKQFTQFLRSYYYLNFMQVKYTNMGPFESFIMESNIDDPELCQKIIAFHKNTDTKHQGLVGSGLKPEFKKSIDAYLDDEKELHRLYVRRLQTIVNQYISKFPCCDSYAPWEIKQSINIQHYSPSEAFYAWHTERESAKETTKNRHLVFMTYLNDVTDGGETEFFHQKLRIKPETGKTLIWPTDWTHTHRGLISPTQDKYIVTGWFDFVENKNPAF